MFSLQGKVAVVTGGAGLLGKQIVAALAQAGAKTYIASRNVMNLETAVKYYGNQGYDVLAIQFDQGDEQSVMSLKNQIMEREGRVDILVNNAVIKTMSDWSDSIEAFAESMKINATGLFIITRAFGDEMANRGKGSIINVASIYGMVGPDGPMYENTGIPGFLPDYSFHKAGMINFTRFTASYYGPWNVRCNCISPAGIETDKTPGEFVRKYKERIFLRRMLNSTDLMGAIVFLASDASAFITGVNIPIDGGYTAR